jgi:uncharacterized membrane protein YqhA
MKSIENVFERMLWNVRLVITLPVLVSVIVAIGVLIITTIDAFVLLGNIIAYVGLDNAARAEVRLETISEVVGILDGFLLGAILIIFALGLYELFVNKIDAAEGSEFAGRLLLIRNLDDLKDRLANVILVILIVKFFQQALKMHYDMPVDLLYLAIGIILIGGALFLTGRAKGGKSSSKATSTIE